MRIVGSLLLLGFRFSSFKFNQYKILPLIEYSKMSWVVGSRKKSWVVGVGVSKCRG